MKPAPPKVCERERARESERNLEKEIIFFSSRKNKFGWEIKKNNKKYIDLIQNMQLQILQTLRMLRGMDNGLE